MVLGLGVLAASLAALTAGVVIGQHPGMQTDAPPLAASNNEPRLQPGLPVREMVDPQVVPAGNPSELPRPGVSAVEPPIAVGSPAQVPIELPRESVEGDFGQTSNNPTGRQEPAVSLEWIGPPVAKLGQPVTYQIIVKNVGSCPVSQVVVRDRLPNGITVNAAEPKPVNEGNVLIWDLGTLQPRQEKRIDLQIVPDVKGDLTCQATVSFSGSATTRLQIREPKLTLKAQAPDKVLLGDAATVTLTVSNPGDGIADHVKIKAILPEGLEHSRGKVIDFDLGNLAPNETRSVQVVCSTKQGGIHRLDAMATADGNLTAQDTAELEVTLPRIDLVLTGPRLRYLDRHAIYVLKVVNPGSAPASNVTVSHLIPAGFKFVSASAGGRHDFASRSVTWFLGDLVPGQSREVNLEVVAVNVGDHRHKATVIAARGLKAEAEVMTRVEGLAAILMELVDLDDPVEVGADTSYEIRVTNTGTKTETGLQLVCTIPDKMEFRGAKGAGGCRFTLEGKDVVFEPLPKLAPRADAIYRVSVRGIAPGDLRFRARVTSDGLTEPVLKEESTRVYGDDLPPR
jgi:uncharacterized repeat protein (TIGR01451 family)